MGPHHVGAGLRALPRDEEAGPAWAGRREPVRGAGELQDHGRSPVADAGEVAAMGALGFRGEHARRDRDPGRAQDRVAAAGDARIGVLERGDDAPDPSRDDRLGVEVRP